MLDKMLDLAGLSGRRTRYTTGEWWWGVALAWGSGFTFGVVLVLVLIKD